MKKIVLALVVLILATPAWSAVTITAEQVGSTNDVDIWYQTTGTGDGNEIRAFGLDITVSTEAEIRSISNLDPNYWVYPGTNGIDINDTTGAVDSTGTPIADPTQAPGDTEAGLDSNGITIEMGSLYTSSAPDPCGRLLTLTVNTNTACTVSVIGNVARAGSGSKPGVVMKNPAVTRVPAFTPAALVFVAPTITISGTITGTGQNNGVTIGGLPGSPVTNGSGFYTCTATKPYTGTGTPTYVSSDYTPASRTYSSENSDKLNQDYASALKTYTVSGTVTKDGAGLDGVTISGMPGSPIVTAGGGNYSDTVNYGWNGTIVASHASYGPEPNDLSPGPVTSTVTGQDFIVFPICWDHGGHCKGNATDISGGAGYVNLDDFIVLRDSYAKTYKNDWNAGAGPYNPCADFDKSGKVNLDDFILLRDNYSTTVSGCTQESWPPPSID